MTLDADACYRAVRARDPRFDGMFFVAVTTTGIYCRPICPARTPGRSRCLFFTRAAEAERAGFRACFRCRPELAPGLSPADSVPRLVRAAAARIDAGYLNERSVDDLATELQVSARHLRRAMEAELGVSPVELAQTRRLALAKQLLHDTTLRLTDVAFAAGFRSVRRFNALFRERFGRSPSAVGKDRGGEGSEAITLRVDYRPPLEWQRLLGFLGQRAIPGVEQVVGDEYRRVVSLDGALGWLAVAPHREKPALRARVSHSLVTKLPLVVARLRALFDLDAQPHVIALHLATEPLLAPLVARAPGLRVPGAFDSFEMATRAVLGQQVSVRAATTLSGRLVAAFGAPVTVGVDGLDRRFPSAAELARIAPARVAAIGLPLQRATTIVELARAVAAGRVDLGNTTAPEQVMERLLELPGVGDWTASYLAMRALRWPDAFPAGDLGVRKALAVTTNAAAEERARAWQPWRAYATMHLWSSL